MNKEKCCRTCRHWTDSPPVQPGWEATPSDRFKFCAIQAWRKNWEGTYQAFMTREDTCCTSQWEEKTNQLELFNNQN